MDEMDAAQAREHIEMVDRILAESSERLCAGGEFFAVWGLYSGFVTLIWQLIDTHVLPWSAVWLQVVALSAAIVFSILRGRYYRERAGRRTFAEREFFKVLWITLGLSFIANLGAFNIFSGWAQAAIWSFGFAVVLFYIGSHGNRRALAGAIVIVASIVAANFAGANIAGYVLAAGMVAGYTGFGVAEMLARD